MGVCSKGYILKRDPPYVCLPLHLIMECFQLVKVGRDRELLDDKNRWVPTNVLSTEHLALTRCRMSAVIHGETLHWSMRGGDDVVSAIRRNQRIRTHFYRLDHSQSLCNKPFYS